MSDEHAGRAWLFFVGHRRHQIRGRLRRAAGFARCIDRHADLRECKPAAFEHLNSTTAIDSLGRKKLVASGRRLCRMQQAELHPMRQLPAPRIP